MELTGLSFSLTIAVLNLITCHFLGQRQIQSSLVFVETFNNIWSKTLLNNPKCKAKKDKTPDDSILAMLAKPDREEQTQM